VAVIERGQVVETGPVWQVFGAPQHEATRALLRTLVHDLPADLAARMRPLHELTQGDAQVLLDVRFTGADEREPDLGALVNAFRSTPFIILLGALLPLTRLLVGKTIGVWAAIVPLSIAAIPFFARVAEVSLREVDRGLIEAAQAMGAQRRHIIWHVLLPEALPGILGGFTITVVAMIGSSAMAGAVGAGGLGDLAIRYGYQRFDTTVMVTVIVLLIVIVTVVQFVGDRFVRRLSHRA
jgi:D-methionine transport system permease protein